MDTPFIVVLDLDGPVCTTRSLAGTGDIFDPVAAGMISRFCDDNGARIVICSARRHNDRLPDDLDRCGLKRHLFCDPAVSDDWRTCHLPDGDRGDEVDTWFADHPDHTRYAIVDDQQGGYGPHQMRRLVNTDMHTGFSVLDLTKLQRIAGHDVTGKDVDDAHAQTPRYTIARLARDAVDALDQGDDDAARRLLALIADHPLAQ